MTCTMRPGRHAWLAALLLPLVWAVSARADSAGPHYKLDEVQATLVVQGLDGWLLVGNGASNPVANELAHPRSPSKYVWFYLIPATGKPVVLLHQQDEAIFADTGVDLTTYNSDRQRRRRLRKMLAGRKQIAAEYAPSSKIPSLNRIEIPIAKEIQRAGASLVSSANLVQFTKSLWGPEGRFAHYLAAHHLDRVRAKALAHLAKEMAAGRELTEYDLQQYILSEYRPRGVIGEPPVVAAGVHSADPSYIPRAGAKAAPIRRGDLVRLSLWGAMQGAPRPIVANVSWTAYVGDNVPSKYADPFSKLVEAREAVIALVRDRLNRRRPVLGFEADRAAREMLTAAGLGDRFTTRTGHSLDTSVNGDGANLEGGERKDTRPLVRGAGFTVEPAIFIPGEYGLKTEVDVFIGKRGVEVTSEAQKTITPIFRAAR